MLYRRLGTIYHSMGNYDEALAMHREDLRIFRDTKGARCVEIGHALNNIGSDYFKQGRLDEALAAFEEALSIMTEAQGKDHIDSARIITNIAAIHATRGKSSMALEVQREALRIQLATTTPDSDQAFILHHNFGLSMMEMEMFDEATTNFEIALDIGRKKHGENHPSVADVLCSLGSAMGNQEKYDEGLRLFKKALKIRRKTLGKNHYDIYLSLYLIGNIYYDQEMHVEALDYWDQSFVVAADCNILDPDFALNHLKSCLCKQKMGDPEGALASARKALEAFRKLGTPMCEPAQHAAYLIKELE